MRGEKPLYLCTVLYSANDVTFNSGGSSNGRASGEGLIAYKSDRSHMFKVSDVSVWLQD